MSAGAPSRGAGHREPTPGDDHDDVAPGLREGRLGHRARWALALRLARREARRHPWRHALVVLLIFVPVLATFAVFSGIDTARGSEQLRLRLRDQGAVASAVALDGGETAIDLDALPPGLHGERLREGDDWFADPDADPDDRAATTSTKTVSLVPGSRRAGRYLVTEGRLPAAPDEVLLSEPVADAGRWGVGDPVESARTGRRFTVAGIGIVADDRQQEVVALSLPPDDPYWGPAGSEPDASSFPIMVGDFAVERRARDQVHLWGDRDTSSPETEAALGQLADQLGGSRVEVGDQRVVLDVTGPVGAVDPAVRLAVVVGAAGLATVVAVVASAAFAVGARRQLRTVGLLTTAGADASVVRAALVLQGAIPGLVAGAAAVAVGLAAVTLDARYGWTELVTGVAGDRARASTFGAALAVALGVGAGVVAAWQPARTASRIPVLAALAGRRPTGPVPARVPLAGLALTLVGFGLLAATPALDEGQDTLEALVPVLGVVAFALGAVGLAPALVAMLGPLADHARGTSRLALRGLVRSRTQSAATVAAAAVVLALPIGVLTTLPDRHGEGAPEVNVDASGRTWRSVDLLRAAGVAVGVDIYSIDAADPGGRVDPEQAAAEVARWEARIREVLGDGLARIEVRRVPWARSVDGVDGSAVGAAAPTIPVAVVDAADAELLDPTFRRELAAGRGVSLAGGSPMPGHLELGSGAGAVRLTMAPRDPSAVPRLDAPVAEVLVPAEVTAGALDDNPLVGVTLVRAEPPTAAEARALDALTGVTGESSVTIGEVRRAMAELASPTSTTIRLESAATARFDRVDGDGGWPLAEIALVAAATVLALLVLTITLTLRAVDGVDDHRAAVAAGAPPGALRRQRAVEGMVLAALAAALALPLGWLPVAALTLGNDPGRGLFGQGVGSPGWVAVPVLAAPALLAGLLWLTVPLLRATLRRGPVDEVLPRW